MSVRHSHAGAREHYQVSASDQIETEVAIFIVDDIGRLIFEGWASVSTPCGTYAHWYRVRFLHEKVDRIRLILPPRLQETPELFCALFCELTRTRGISPWDEFFPDDQPRRTP
jgi:hypothetical protein